MRNIGTNQYTSAQRGTETDGKGIRQALSNIGQSIVGHIERETEIPFVYGSASKNIEVRAIDQVQQLLLLFGEGGKQG
jgi:hypothetical protein